jgi:N-acetylglucosaminyl-diphospho-decaprenol L-rhamnosyltransferase
MVPTVVIVNYCTADLAIACLQSLIPELQPERGDRVVVVDGASPDDSVEQIRHAIEERGWDERVTLKVLDCNKGFAFANNAAIRDALTWEQPPEFFWLLNPDTLVRPHTLEVLLSFLKENPSAGIVGGGIDNQSGQPEHSSFRFPSFWSELDLHLRWGAVTRLLKDRIVAQPLRDDLHRTEWVCGANVMIRRQVFEQVGLMDEGYFLYYEETDLCRRASQAGWECWSLPHARVIHVGGAATGILHDNHETRRRPRYWFDSRRRYFRKHYGWAYAAATDAASVLSLLSWKCRRVVQRKPATDPPWYLFDLCRHSALRGGPQL